MCRCDGGCVDLLLLTLRQVAARLGCSLSTAKRLTASGELPTVRLGSVAKVRTADLAEFVSALAPGSRRITTKTASGPVPVEAKPVDPALLRRLDGYDLAGGRAEAGSP